MRFSLCWLLPSLVFGACQAQQSPDALQAGEQALRAENPQAALHQFDLVLRQQPRQERALVLRSKARYQLWDYRQRINAPPWVKAVLFAA